MNPNTITDFEKQFSAKVEPGTHKFYRKMPVSWSAYNHLDYEMHTEIVPALTIHMTEDEFHHMTMYIPGRIVRERRLREDIPAIQKAWDNYQLLLKMCGGDYI